MMNMWMRAFLARNNSQPSIQYECRSLQIVGCRAQTDYDGDFLLASTQKLAILRHMGELESHQPRIGAGMGGLPDDPITEAASRLVQFW